MKNEKLKYYIALSIILFTLIVSTLLKVTFIESKELWLDETYSSFLVGNSLSQMMSYIKGDLNPPFYYVCLKLWTFIFGSLPQSLKAFSVFVNVIASLIFFLLVKKVITNRWICIFCFLLFQFSPVLFWYSTEVRAYMLATLFVLISGYFFFNLIRAESFDLKSILLFSLFSACAFYTHYITLLILPGYLLFYLYLFRKKIDIKPIIASAVVFLIFTGPWYPTLSQQRTCYQNLKREIDYVRQNPDSIGYRAQAFQKPSFYSRIINITENMASILGVYPLNKRLLSVVIGFPFVLVLIYFIFAIFKYDKISILILVIIGVYIIEGLVLQLSSRRFYIFLTPFLILLIGIVVNNALQINYLKHLSIVIMLIIFGFYVAGSLRIYKVHYCKPTTTIVKFLKENYQPNDVIVFNSLYYQVPFEYHASQFKFYPNTRGFPISIYDWWNQQPCKGWTGPVVTKSDLAQFIERLRSDNSIKSVWLILFESRNFDPADQLLSELKRISRSFKKCKIDFGKCADKPIFESKYRVFRIEVN